MKTCFASFLLALLTFIPNAQARLGDDLDSLEKRFGQGKPVERGPAYDKGLWALFDEIWRFEKSGIVIVTGMAKGKCEAITYEMPPAIEGQKEAPEGMSWTVVQTLLAKNQGEGSEGSFRMRSSTGSLQRWIREDDSAFAKIEMLNSRGPTYSRVSLFSHAIYDGYEAFEKSNIRSGFLNSHPPKPLSDF